MIVVDKIRQLKRFLGGLKNIKIRAKKTSFKKVSLQTLSTIIVACLCLLTISLNLNLLQLTNAHESDAYFYNNNFLNSLGIDATRSIGFANMGGYYEATLQQSELFSTCITLPQSGSSSFVNWSFLEIELSHLDDLGTNSLMIEDCFGNPLLATPFTDIPGGTSSFDISSIVSLGIVLKYSAEHTDIIPGLIVPSRVVKWSAYGKSNGVTTLSITPDKTAVDSGQTVTFNIEISSSVATTVSPVLEIDLTRLNGNGTSIGTSEDSTVCYDLDLSGVAGDSAGECGMFRPLELVSLGNGPNGEVPTHPGIGSTQGIIRWNLNSISYGTSITIPITFRVPKGYVNGKNFYLEAQLTHGSYSFDNNYNNRMLVVSDSSANSVSVVSLERQFALTSSIGNVGSTATNVMDYYYNPDNSANNPSDFESVNVKIYNTGNCNVGYRNTTITSPSNNLSRIVNQPLQGENMSSSNAIEIRIFRTPYLRTGGSVYIYYDVGSTVPSNMPCSDGEQIRIIADFNHKELNYSLSRSHNVDTVVCRSGSHVYMHRVQAGNFNNNYSMWPAYSEYYLTNGVSSIRPGEYYNSWGFYSNDGNRTHTVTLQKSYYIVNVPEYSSFHGLRSFSGTVPKYSIYKDVTGTAPLPNEVGFDITFDEYDSLLPDTPHPDWNIVTKTWSGSPFTDIPSATNPSAVITGQSGERLLIVKYDDDPPGTGNQGVFTPLLLWKACDGEYCPTPPSGTQGRVNVGSIFTQYEDNINFCISRPGQTFRYEEVSWPRVYINSSQDAYPSGSAVNLSITPHNQKSASSYVKGFWGINLFNIRDSINFDNITGNITGTVANYPAPDQNILGQACDISVAQLHIPDKTDCLNSTDGASADCFVYWEIPDACQVPNTWGYNISGIQDQDSYRIPYNINFSIPTYNNVPADTPLTFNGEVRRSDLSALGADNAAPTSSWPASRYQDSTTITITETPAIDGSQVAPVQWGSGNIMAYNLSLKNIGNAPNKGVYLIDLLPKLGTGSSTFTPEYLNVYSTLLPLDAVYKYSSSSNCYAMPFDASVIWQELNSLNTTRSGYSSQSDTIPQEAVCIQVHIADSSSYVLQPNDSILYALDVEILDSISDGERFENRAKVGLSTQYGSKSEVPAVDVNVVLTEVGDTLVLDLDKSFEIDRLRPGYVLWSLDYRNLSSANTTDVLISDILPSNMIFDSVDNDSLGALEECVVLNCQPTDINPDGTGGTIQFNITSLTESDGNIGGTDEGQIRFWAYLLDPDSNNELVYNHAMITPTSSGIGASANSSFTTTRNEGILNVAANPDLGGSPVYVRKESWGLGTYRIEIVNNESAAVYFSVVNELPTEIDFVSGTLKINSASASNTLITNDFLNVEASEPTLPGQSFLIEFDFTVDDSVSSGSLISNQAIVSHCINPLNSITCVPARLTNLADFVVFNEEPIVVGDSVFTIENTVVRFNALDNDSDPDDFLNVASLNFTDATNGTLDYLGVGEFEYTPNTDYWGADSFTYEICDSGTPVKCNSGVVDIYVKAIPVAQEDFTVLDEDTTESFTVHENDFVEDSTLDLDSISIHSYPSNGELIYDEETYSFTYTPNPNYFGLDQFEYEICDVDGICTIGTVYLIVSWVNDVPIANDDTFTIHKSTFVDVLANDVDIDDGLDLASFRIVQEPLKGTVVFDVPRGQAFYSVWVSDKSYTDEFIYEICDYSGECDQARVTIHFQSRLATTGFTIVRYVSVAVAVLVVMFFPFRVVTKRFQGLP